MDLELQTIERKFQLFTNGKRSKRKIRHHFFSEICTSIQAYLLGFIAADGCVNECRHALVIQLSDKDVALLELFKIISPDAKISHRDGNMNAKGRNGSKIVDHGSTRLVIHSKMLYDSLLALGIEPKKTYKQLSIPKQIPQHLQRFFILGYFDGDGYATSFVLKRYNTLRAKAGICSKTNNILLEFQQEFANNGIKTNLTYDRRDDMYHLTTASSAQILAFYQYLYTDTALGLERKKDKLWRFLYDKEALHTEYLQKIVSSEQLCSMKNDN